MTKGGDSKVEGDKYRKGIREIMANISENVMCNTLAIYVKYQ